ncbi:MAG: copper amine oxidase N-terminal domain-containing protein [Oscillospiraceae bacterium]|nr:copper amine oxidase N-terminal domain-containing protein [Oscillospiraceae bacterium]
MKNLKKALLFALAAAMLLLTACGAANTNDDQLPEENYPNYEQPVTLPQDIDPDDVYTDYEPDLDADFDPDYVWPTIFVNGEGLPGVDHIIIGDDIFPTHVPLVPVATALGVNSIYTLDAYPLVVMLEGLNGDISFTVGSEDFTVNGETITLNQPSVAIDGVVYVPVVFFRDVFGGSAFSSGGEVHISAEADEMM